jgi:hypothetical protein
MSANQPDAAPPSTGSGLSLDVWAVIIALALALAVKLEIFKNVPW